MSQFDRAHLTLFQAVIVFVGCRVNGPSDSPHSLPDQNDKQIGEKKGKRNIYRTSIGRQRIPQ